MNDETTEKAENSSATYQGLAISPGLAMGTAYVYRDILQRELEYHSVGEADAGEEWTRIENAVELVSDDLKRTARNVKREVDDEASKIFLAQEVILRDPALTDDLKETLEKDMVNAEHVVKRVFLRWERRFQQADREDIVQRGDDVADLARRLLMILQGIHAHTLEDLPDNSVLVARRLLPSDTVFLSRHSTTAVVVEEGGRVSHAAILTREMGVPGVARIPHVLDHVRRGDTVFVDGDDGNILVNPYPALKKSLQERMHMRWAETVRATSRCRAGAVTRDGREIAVLANVSCREDIERAALRGADGIGLYRTEHLYLSRHSPPSEDMIVKSLAESLAPLRGKPAVLRLLDAGGDKHVPYLNIAPEQNPFLGRRGIRLLLEYQDLLSTQLRAFVRLAADYDVRIMVPMVTVADDMKRTRQCLREAATDLGVAKPPPLGSMIETPAAALCAADIAAHADFLSIGTNDLTQYTMAADRENPAVNTYFVDHHACVMRLIGIVAAEASGCPVSLCGELAGRTEALPTLVELGIGALSVAPPLIPELKERIRSL
jgi:phosphoenolpyruvate-protein phosphotransferase